MEDVLGHVLAGLQILIIVGGLIAVWVRLTMRVKALAGEQKQMRRRCDGLEDRCAEVDQDSVDRCEALEEESKRCREKQDGRYETILRTLGDIKGDVGIVRQRVEDLIAINGSRPHREGK